MNCSPNCSRSESVNLFPSARARAASSVPTDAFPDCAYLRFILRYGTAYPNWKKIQRESISVDRRLSIAAIYRLAGSIEDMGDFGAALTGNPDIHGVM